VDGIPDIGLFNYQGKQLLYSRFTYMVMGELVKLMREMSCRRFY